VDIQNVIFGLKGNRFMMCYFLVLSQLTHVFVKVYMNTMPLEAARPL
jgi:hypothetical protein